jgi:hypothetical protein
LAGAGLAYASAEARVAATHLLTTLGRAAQLPLLAPGPEMAAPDAEAAMRDYEQSVRDALREVGGLGDEIDNLPPETVARIFAEVQQGDLEEARRLLADVESNLEPIRLQIDLEDLETVRRRKYYLPPGAYSIAFENTPALGELNQFFLSGRAKPMEQADDALGTAMYILRRYTGLDVAEVSPRKTAAREEPVTYQKTKKPF